MRLLLGGKQGLRDDFEGIQATLVLVRADEEYVSVQTLANFFYEE